MHPMHHTIQRDLMQARVADLQREAEQHRLIQAASQPAWTRLQHSRPPARRRTAIIIVRRALAALGARL